mgnify:CR=1 FL=1
MSNFSTQSKNRAAKLLCRPALYCVTIANWQGKDAEYVKVSTNWTAEDAKYSIDSIKTYTTWVIHTNFCTSS